MNLHTITEHYIAAALWTTSVEEEGLQALRAAGADLDGAAGDWGLDRCGLTISDLDSTVRATINETVRAFVATAPKAALRFWADNEGDEAIGHDLFLTSAGHGAGFWDRYSGDSEGARYGQQLTDHAEPYGELYLYVGDDGRIYS